jgi:hypothetical protein
VPNASRIWNSLLHAIGLRNWSAEGAKKSAVVLSLWDQVDLRLATIAVDERKLVIPVSNRPIQKGHHRGIAGGVCDKFEVSGSSLRRYSS